MPHTSNATELQLRTVQRNYESISKMMHGKQQECDKVSHLANSGTWSVLPAHTVISHVAVDSGARRG